MAKNRNIPAFDENLLIGSISGLNKNKGTNSPTETPHNPLPPDTDLPLENKDSPISTNNEAPVSTPDPSGEESKKEKEDNPLPSAKPKPGKHWNYERFLKPTPGRKESRVYISDPHFNKIRRILAFTDKKIAIADYLENILEEHFEKYDAQINELYKK